MSEAKEITKKESFNLAFAFFSLPKETRQDITTFYAFCRQVDDAADDPDVPLPERSEMAARLASLAGSGRAEEPEFASELRTLIANTRSIAGSSKKFCLVWKWISSLSDSKISKRCTDTVTASPARWGWSVLRYSATEIRSPKNMRTNWGWRFN